MRDVEILDGDVKYYYGEIDSDEYALLIENHFLGDKENARKHISKGQEYLHTKFGDRGLFYGIVFSVIIWGIIAIAFFSIL